LPEPKRHLLERAERVDSILGGRRVLIVDDDLRNIFALTTVLERAGMVVTYTENGKDALEVLSQSRDLDIALIDIMMPEMDGYELARRIRKLPGFEDFPLIALTAKAMKTDRDKCMEAGASDYIAKPVDTDHLLSLLRVWVDRSLHRPKRAA